MTGKEFAKRIDAVLLGRNQSRKAITSDLGISSSTMSSWAAGRGSIPNVNVAAKIAHYLDVSLDWLVTGEERETTHEEAELLRRLRGLSPASRDAVLTLLNALYERENKES